LSVSYQCEAAPTGGGNARFTFNAYSDTSSASFGGSPVAVDTTVTIEIQFDTLIENRIENIVISTGNSSGSIILDTFEGDYIEVPLTINSITPSSFGSQNYSSGGVQSLGTCPP
jgi:hypothetical protein